jgi:HEPN domain-containing protein
VLYDAGLFASSVFHVHLHLEKVLKGLMVEAGSTDVPYIHNLVRLLRLTAIAPPAWLIESLATLSPHAIDARYLGTSPDSPIRYTAPLCEKLMREASEATTWLRQQLM